MYVANWRTHHDCRVKFSKETMARRVGGGVKQKYGMKTVDKSQIATGKS